MLDDLCRQVAELHAQGIGYADMTILVRANREALPIIDAFAARPDMPRIISDEAFMLQASQSVRLIVETLRWLDNSEDQIANYYLRTRLTDKTLWQQLQTEATAMRQMPLADLVERIYRQLGLDGIAGQDTFVMTFLDAVNDYISNGHADIHNYITLWDEKLIRIMTLHKSKGLEFNTVFVPFCTWPFEGSHGNMLWVSPTEAPYDAFSLLPITPTSKTAPNSVFARDYAEERLNSRLDEFNALYVALTRARANLLIWAVGRSEPGSLNSVGDLMAQAQPLTTTLTEEPPSPTLPFTLYTTGQPCPARAKSADHTRMDPAHQIQPIGMVSFDARLPFRQSNRSQLFFANPGADDDASIADNEALRRQHNMEFGQLIHSVLQQVRTRDDLNRVLDACEQEGVISRTAPDGTYVSIRRADLQQRLSRTLDDPRVAEWYDPSWRLFTECAIVVRQPDGTAHTLRPDRVVMSTDGSRIIVIDYKTARPSSQHHEQVGNYMLHLRAMYPQAHVEGHLWYVLTGDIEDVKQTKA